MTDRPPSQIVDVTIVRKLFNDGNYRAKQQAGEFQARIRRNSHPSPAPAGEPFCTRSQTVAYLDNLGRRIAVVHQYLRPDGTIGASGRPDPKALLIDGILYFVAS